MIGPEISRKAHKRCLQEGRIRLSVEKGLYHNYKGKTPDVVVGKCLFSITNIIKRIYIGLVLTTCSRMRPSSQALLKKKKKSKIQKSDKSPYFVLSCE